MTKEETFDIAVIIPMYNAEKYVEKAIRSALDQPYVTEVWAIDDGFPDSAKEIAKRIAGEDDRVQVLSHEGNVNKGAGPSRNLGLSHATAPYIAFLDADDYFLPGRFEKTMKILQENPLASAVYEAVGTEFLGDTSKEDFARIKNIPVSEADSYLTFPSLTSSGRDFFNSILSGKTGAPCTDGITVRREVLEKTGLFRTDLRLHQDTELWIRIAYHGYFVAGSATEPIAMRGWHGENRIAQRNIESNYQLREVLFREWYSKPGVTKESRKELLRKYLQASTAHQLQSLGLLTKIWWRLRYLIRLPFMQ